ncbi:hypothetical protein Pmar_PMAR010216 [Perkinsus marinus ATCC 50983]|uniref:Uncharacterized protein n=1 Tax=Perkinsus marinus (strain ATCC 50983 / TXsc) TaxID=423536 RepID=C5K552_PERM5|nr:hypothetical protein Pmar_PMAR010216 [Perkinsus marinus ATCC 50983]EER20474.1 hypothetical protein Pmar_PMAR010216 [Perkinsus marinus ATCC 50983]|eukprot:XP_002788678.1 hypothetical protein Pmar_PMAR010216 [Perkinsus marinus ATCC 50983]
MDILGSSTVKSDEELNRRLDDLIASPACDVTPTVDRSVPLDVLRGRSRDKGSYPRSPSGGHTLGTLLQEGQHSDHYIPRAPRLPGYPDPPPDEWGDWDEYRDDRDPGYRVRDVEENELMREIALNERQGRGSIASHAPPTLDGLDRPSGDTNVGVDDDDELLLAHPVASAVDGNASPSTSEEGNHSSCSEPEKPPSPSFGRSGADIPKDRVPPADTSQHYPSSSPAAAAAAAAGRVTYQLEIRCLWESPSRYCCES